MDVLLLSQLNARKQELALKPMKNAKISIRTLFYPMDAISFLPLSVPQVIAKSHKICVKFPVFVLKEPSNV